MSRLSQRALPNSAIAVADYPASGQTRRIRHDSFSGSESSSGYSPYNSALKHELLATEDDMHAALTAQSLNADGTPKRPMNAFMIFARKRRPEVSAANQTMRTGDISKILSGEWNSMGMQDKQFYLDQAKKLKDNFNAKYPDYVYRRRPNNSRKKRRTDGGPNHLPDSFDGGDDFTGTTDWEDQSPVEGDEVLGAYATQELQYPRSHHALPSMKDEDIDFPLSAYSRSTAAFPSYENPAAAQFGSPRFSGASIQNAHPYQAQSHMHASGPGSSQPTSMYADHGTGHNMWNSTSGIGRTDQNVRNQSWSIPPLNLGNHQEQTLAALANPKSDIYSPRSWSSSTSSSSASGNSASPHVQNLSFPTLSSPYYSQQQQQQHAPGRVEDITPRGANSSQNYFSSSPQGSFAGRQGGQYEHGNFMHDTNLAASGLPAYLSGVHGDHSVRSRTPGLSRPLPSIQPLSAYGLPQSIHGMNPSPSTSAHSAHLGYWDRDRVDGQ